MIDICNLEHGSHVDSPNDLWYMVVL